MENPFLVHHYSSNPKIRKVDFGDNAVAKKFPYLSLLSSTINSNTSAGVVPL
jgi:hypothetical protein